MKASVCRVRNRSAVVWLPVLLLLAVDIGTAAADWPMLRGDVQRSGVAQAPVSGDLQVAWTVRLGLSVDCSPAVVGEKVYVGSDDGTVSCLQAEDGRLLWQARTGGAVVSSPAVYGAVVCVGSADRCIYAFDANTGKRLWRVRTWRPIVASPLVLEDRAYIGSLDGSFKCLQMATGAVVWEHQGGPFSASPAADSDGVIYCGDEEGRLWARRADSGQELWEVEMDGGVVSAPLVTENHVIAGVMAPSALRVPRIRHLVVLERTTGQQVWAKEGQSSVLHTPIADGNRVYYSIVSGYTSSTEMFAARLQDGAEVWKARLGGVADSSPALCGDHLLFGLHDSHFYTVDKRGGRVLQRLPLGGKVYSSPAIADGRVYVGTGDGNLYCLEPAATALLGTPQRALAER